MSDFTQERSFFARQPAHVVLVDGRIGQSLDICKNVTSTMERFFSLVCSLSGQARVPFFGLVVAMTDTKIILPLQHTKGNYSRIKSALAELHHLILKENQDDLRPNILGAVESTISMFSKHAACQKERLEQNGLLELTIFTKQSPNQINTQVRKAIYMKHDHITKIQIAQLTNSWIGDSIDNSERTSSSEDESMSPTMGYSMIENCVLDSDVLAIDNFFRGWLKDQVTDKEHLRLVWSNEDRQEPLILKCDLNERLLNPTQLQNFSNNYLLHTDGARMEQRHPTQTTKLPVYVMRVTNRVPIEQVCESIIYGTPTIVRATRCWAMEWEDLENNEQQCNALCQILAKKNEALLVQLHTPHIQNTSPLTSQNAGYFILLPSTSNSLLLKPVASAELLLPCDVPFTTDDPDQSSVDMMTDILDTTPQLGMLNPVLLDTGLYPRLKNDLVKTPYCRPQPEPVTPRLSHGRQHGMTSFMKASDMHSNAMPNRKAMLTNPYRQNQGTMNTAQNVVNSRSVSGSSGMKRPHGNPSVATVMPSVKPKQKVSDGDKGTPLAAMIRKDDCDTAAVTQSKRSKIVAKKKMRPLFNVNAMYDELPKYD